MSFKSALVKDYMSGKLVTFTPDTDVLDAIHELLQHRIAGAPVIDDHGNLVGMLSEMDCLDAILSSTYNESGLGHVGAYMTSDDLVVTTTACDVVDVAQRMMEHKMRRLPVVDGKRLVGQITCRQILQAVKNFSR